MKVYSKDLLRAITAVGRAISPKPVLPVHECYYLSSNGESLEVRASDGNLTLSVSIECKGELKMLVPARVFSDYVKALPECALTLEYEDGQVKAGWTNGHSAFPCRDISEWPEENMDGQNLSPVALQPLKGAITHVINCAGSDDLRPQLCGVYIDAGGGNAVATDGHVCATVPLAIEGGSFILPRSLASFIKDTDSGEDTAYMGCNEQYVYFSCGAVKAVARKLEQRYPNYAAIFPSEVACKMTIDRKLFLGALRRVMVCSSKVSKTVRLKLGALGSEIQAQDVDFSTSAREDLEDMSYDGAPMTIGFNGDYLQTVLGQMTSDKATLGINAPNKGVLVTGDESRTVLMPVMLND